MVQNGEIARIDDAIVRIQNGVRLGHGVTLLGRARILISRGVNALARIDDPDVLRYTPLKRVAA